MLISKDGGANYGKYENPQVDQILEEFGKTVDENKEVQYIKQLCQIWLQDVPAAPVYMATLFYEANTEYWTNWPNEKNPYGVPIFWTNYGTWGTAPALLGVKPAKVPVSETTTTSAPATTSSSESPTSSTSSGGGGICGPGVVVLLAAVPLLKFLAESLKWRYFILSNSSSTRAPLDSRTSILSSGRPSLRNRFLKYELTMLPPV
ncbi:hypothetical protein [Thermococcus sp. 2319x1]|uniref:hypothetical protein n=1 Tax=Thermococcus sp. 2319x1 TaxID=1674923 RepID=UPI00373FDB1D